MDSQNKKANILIVDDEPNALKVLSAILKEIPYNTYLADGVDKAKEIVSSEDIDVVITDLKMPGKDGLHLFKYLKSHYPDIPVIFLTAFGTVDSAVTAMTDGAFFYFIKPPDYVKMKAILSKAVEQKQLKMKLPVCEVNLNQPTDFPALSGKVRVWRMYSG